MSILSKENVKELIRDNNFKTSDEVLGALKDMFRDVLQEMLEAELD